MKIYDFDIDRLQARLGKDMKIFPPVNEYVRVQHPDKTFSLWKLDNKDFVCIFLRVYNRQTNSYQKIYSFPSLRDISDNVCVMVCRDKIPYSETKYSYGEFEDSVYYATIKNNEFVRSCKFKSANDFKNGMGVVENFKSENGCKYSYVGIDHNQHFVYYPQKYLCAYDFEGNFAKVRNQYNVLQLIDKQGNIVDANLALKKSTQFEK